MNKWVSMTEAAEFTGLELKTFKRLMNSVNPPPFSRPSIKTTLFSTEKLKEWQDSWVDLSHNA